MLVAEVGKEPIQAYSGSHQFVTYADIEKTILVKGPKFKQTETENCSVLAGPGYVSYTEIW